MTVLIDDPDFTLHVGDVRDVLATLPDESVHCVVTSPPYWGLRDYGTGSWDGGDAACDHRTHAEQIHEGGRQGNAYGTPPGAYRTHRRVSLDECGKCGARRVDKQLGLEPTPEEYVANMVGVFREVRRVLRRDGTCWLNIGDSYAGGGGYAPDAPINQRRANGEDWGKFHPASASALSAKKGTGKVLGLKPKDLVGIPWRLAFALQADGWYLRSDVIWSKPNPMPESVTDRPTKAHEYLFLLTRSPRYFYDADAIREPAKWERWGDQTNGKHEGSGSAAGWIGSKPKEQLQGGRHARRYSAEDFKTTDERNTRFQGPNPEDGGRNRRSVWEIATEPYPDAHFATFPQALVEPCVLAGTSERGCCPECGAPWEREVEATKYEPAVVESGVRFVDESRGDKTRKLSGAEFNKQVKRETTGWRPTCDCLCPVCTVESTHETSQVSEMRRAVQAEVSAESEVLLGHLRGASQCEQETAQDEDVEGIRGAVHAGASVGVEAGVRDGASRGDGAQSGSSADVGRGRASQERGQGRQPALELGSDDALSAQPGAEEASASPAVPALSASDLGEGPDKAHCAACGTPLATIAAVVCDIFMGSGTTAVVARRLGRRAVGIELNADYAKLIVERTKQLSLLA